jgi:hypothetical protein
MDERYECIGVRPKALVFRFYSDGSYEEFWGTGERRVAHEQILGASSIRQPAPHTRQHHQIAAGVHPAIARALDMTSTRASCRVPVPMILSVIESPRIPAFLHQDVLHSQKRARRSA